MSFLVIPVILIIIGVVIISKNKVIPGTNSNSLRIIGFILLIGGIIAAIVFGYVLFVLSNSGPWYY